MPNSYWNLLRLDEEKLDSVTASCDEHLRQQRSKVIKLAVCLDRFIQIKVLDGKVKANIHSYAAKDLHQLIKDLSSPNRSGLGRKDYNDLEPEEIAAIERAEMEGTREWAERHFEQMEDGSVRPNDELNNAYRARLRVWMKNGELDHVFGHSEHEVVENHKELIQDAIPNSMHLINEIDASDLMDTKLAFTDTLDPSAQTKLAPKTESKAYSELAHHSSFVGTFGGQIPVVDDPNAATDSSEYSRPVKVYWETPEGDAKVLKFGPKCNLAEFSSFVVSKLDRDYLMNLGDEVPPFEIESNYFDCTFRPEQFGIVDAVRKYLLPGAIGRGQSGMFDKDNHTINIHLSHMEIHQANPGQERVNYQVQTDESRTHIGTLVVRLPTPHSGATLCVHLKTHTATFAPVPNSTSIHYTVIPSDVPFSYSPLLSGTLPILIYKIHCTPTTPIPPTLSITSFPIFSTIITLMTCPTFLRRGGTVGFHLRHNYSHTSEAIEDATHLSRLLRGSDLALFTILRSLDLKPTISAVVANDWDSFATPVASKVKHANASIARGSLPSEAHTTQYSALTGALQSIPEPLYSIPYNTHPSVSFPLDDPVSAFPGATVDPGSEETDTDGILRWTLELDTIFGPAQYLDRSYNAVENLCEQYERRAHVRSDLAWGDWERHLGLEKDESEDEDDFRERMKRKKNKVHKDRDYVYVLDEIVDVQADGICDGTYLGSMFNLQQTRRDDIKWVNRPRHLSIQGVYPTMASTPGCHARTFSHNASDTPDPEDPDNIKVLATDVIGEFCRSSAAILVAFPGYRERCILVDDWCLDRKEKAGEVEIEGGEDDDDDGVDGVDAMDVDDDQAEGRKRKREGSL